MTRIIQLFYVHKQLYVKKTIYKEIVRTKKKLLKERKETF